ncbi:hypothetical protein C8J27_108152 [Rhodobacter aestuarii]|uniref:Uncharacterized protein n=1 Tax=Rhodobacter aestuarii TaxID=453582 RepID=A0A1N7PH59_9RHOB|nr:MULTISPECIES: hypothetical protein [Rhodobacter]PTV94416.1 hypothetical protein C8J27_108152 [Rhodobacter aestuarii]SIT09954.1 hypothetical protein SAMN05421580_1109 [Rhodobacter aestuarii]SOC03627.1 hypothetical protein SAMN05877809_10318 [Rhodobacter sp. JA431]
MTEDTTPTPQGKNARTAAPQSREERLAAQLRANLMRRKAQARQRDAAAGGVENEAESGSEGNQ